jgi:hypothetical protein
MRSLIRPLSLTVAVLALLPAGVRAAPVDELLRFVPADVAFCCVLRDLRAHSATLLSSPFAREVRKTALYASLANAPELAQVAKAEKFFEKHLGLTFAQLRDDVLGDAVVLAYRPGPPGKPDQEQGLLLVRARTAKVLADLADRINRAQKDSGELKELSEREHKGVKYVRRVEKKGDRTEENFYLLRGPVLAFSAQESFLRQAIERDKALAKDAEPPLLARLGELGLRDCPLALAINPRAFDPHQAAREGKPDAGTKAFEGVWKAMQGVGLGVRLGKDVSLTVAVRLKLDDLPAPARRSVERARQASELWQQFPSDALFAVAGRTDFVALFDFLASFMSPDSRKSFQADLHRTVGAALGKDVLGELLPAIGPDWGLCVTAPPADAKTWAPRALAALRISARPAGDGNPADEALLSAIHSWAVLAVLAHNKQHPNRAIRLRSAVVGGVKVKYLAGVEAFPPGVEPAVALKGGYLLLGSSPDAIRDFGASATTIPAGTVPLVRVSFRAWRSYLKDRRDDLASFLAAREKSSRAAALAKLDGLRDSLTLIDAVELRQKVEGGVVALTLAVRPAFALKK